MIDTSGLRRGNLVQNSKGEILTVATIDEGGINEYWNGPVAIDIQEGLYEIIPGISFEDIDPIPLTPEWLEKMGFKEGSRSKYFNEIDWYGPNGMEIQSSKDRPDSLQLFGSEWTLGAPFHYVHQLQNLYFSLYQEELSIKDT